jgi:outer membrane protein insertion porin family
MEDLERIEKKYIDSGRLNPLVGPFSYKGGVLRLRVEPGGKLAIHVSGNESVRTGDLKSVMPFHEAREVRDDLISEAVERMLGLYHEKGFANAQVAPVVTRDDDEVVLNFYVFEGDKVLVESIKISGAGIPEDRIKGMMSLRTRGAFNPELLRADAEKIKMFHAALGYIDAEVKPPRAEIYKTWARVSIEVSPGAKVVVSAMEVRGVERLSEREVFEALDIKAGEPYNEADISEARRKILAIYRSRGYPECGVEITRDFTPGGARVVFNVKEGERLFFGKTVVSGNRETRVDVITRELRYREGMLFNTSLIAETRQRLLRLGLFSSIDFRTIEKADSTVDFELEVVEGKPGTVEFGFGYGEYEEFRGFFDISYRNLFGMNRQISLRTEVSSLGNKEILTFREPYLFGRKIESRTFLLREDRKEKNIDTGETRYRVKKNTASTGVEKNIGNNFKASLFYEFSVVETTDVKPGVVLSPEDVGTLAISSLSPGIIYDSRDNPFDPQKGILAGVTVKTASNLFISETDFVKTTARFSTYHRLARWLVAALSLRGGTASGFRDTEELPLVERFFLGGRNTVRGFDQDTLGPKSPGPDRTPVGGNAFLLGNLELRTRIFRNFRFVPFVDFGNVWLRNRDVGLDELRYAAGLGLQYNTPVGPVRLDYGFKIDREPEESPAEFHFSLGHAF